MHKEEVIQFGEIRSEGGCMNYSKPILLDCGRKVAVASGLDIRILNVADSCHVRTLGQHSAKVVGMVLEENESVVSCDEDGALFRWSLKPDGVECDPLNAFPIPPKSKVEHLAYLSSQGAMAVVVTTDNGTGPRELLLQRNIGKMMVGRYNVLVSDIIEGYNKFAFSSCRSFCAVLTSTANGPACNIVPVYATNTDAANRNNLPRNKRILTGQREPTCVAVHPSEDVVAVGDHFGGVEVYHGVLKMQRVTSKRFHWHHMPLLDVIFSHSGTELYSSGHEGVLVQWHLDDSAKEEKNFLPRLGQPITHMAISSDCSTMITSHSDNSFSLVNLFEFKLVSVLLGQGVAMDYSTNDTESKLPPLMLYDNRTQAIVTKAKPGYLHFYHMATQQQLFLLDAVHENYVPDATGSRDVSHLSLSQDGLTMATVDCVGGQVDTQNLKLWRFDRRKHQWRLETSIADPHYGQQLGGCVLQPCEDGGGAEDHTDRPLCLSWSLGGQVKIWAADVLNDCICWSYLSSSSHHSGVARSGCWSPCGTAFAVACGAVCGVWLPQPLQLVCTLSHLKLQPDDVTAMHFSPHCRVLVTASRGGAVTGWCLATRRLLYTTPLQAVLLQQDATGLMAAATEAGDVVLLYCEEGVPLCRLSVGRTAPLALLFCPALSWPRHLATRLLYYTADREMKSVLINLRGSDSNLEELPKESTAEGSEESRQSRLSIMMADTTAAAAPTASIFEFTARGQTPFLRPDFFVKEFEGKNHQRPCITALLTYYKDMLKVSAAT